MNAAELLDVEGASFDHTKNSKPGNESEEAYEEKMASRWRKAILRLSETFMDAAGERSDLSPILLEAMHNALNNLLIYGEAGDLLALEEWLSMEDNSALRSTGDTSAGAGRGAILRGRDRRANDRRTFFQPVTNERRASSDRRAGERRALRDWQFESIPASPLETPETTEG